MDELFMEAVRLSDVGRHKKALTLFLKLAENGNIGAMTRLGIIYCEELGTEIDYEESIKWDLRAIEAGDIVAMENLALTFCRQREFRKARYWFERAVSAGDGDAALELARLLHVSDHEKDNVLRFLNIAINSSSITPDSREKAEVLRSLLEHGIE